MHQKYSTILLQIYKNLLRTLKPSGWWPAQTPLEVIVGAILTQNTSWTNVEKALKNLEQANILHDGPRLLALTDTELASMIRPAGFFNIKTKRLKALLQYFSDRCSFSFDFFIDIPYPKTRKELLSVYGVGPETADSILLYALKKPTFVVDAYTRRILVRHNIITQKASYEDIRMLYLDNLPEDIQLFNEYHALIVRACKNWCHSKQPHCNLCPIKNIT